MLIYCMPGNAALQIFMPFLTNAEDAFMEFELLTFRLKGGNDYHHTTVAALKLAGRNWKLLNRLIKHKLDLIKSTVTLTLTLMLLL